MNLNFKISNLPPCPRNRSHMLTVSKGRPMMVKTALTRAFEKDLRNRLSMMDLTALKSFNPNTQHLEMTLTIYTPFKELFNLKGGVSQLAVDFDAHKVFVDIIFDHIGINDKFVRTAHIITKQSKDEFWNYDVFLTIKENAELI